jgi:hypothetical protein
MNAVDHVEAALERLTRGDIAALPPARRKRLQAMLSAWQCLCDDIASDRIEKILKCTTAAGVVAQLNQGERSQ